MIKNNKRKNRLDKALKNAGLKANQKAKKMTGIILLDFEENALSLLKIKIQRPYAPYNIENAIKEVEKPSFIDELADIYVSHLSDPEAKESLERAIYYGTSLLAAKSIYDNNNKKKQNPDSIDIIRTMNKLEFLQRISELSKNPTYVTILYSDNLSSNNIALQELRFSLDNDNEKIDCEMEIERLKLASIVISVNIKNKIEKRGYLIKDNKVLQISKEEMILSDVTDAETGEFVPPIRGTIYMDD